MNIKQRFDYKKCPRCNFRTAKSGIICPNCSLNYTKFDMATNLEAKDAISKGEKARVLMRKGCPTDVNRLKLTLLTIFLGFLGAHLYYVGRWKKAIFYTVFFMIGVAYSIITTSLTISSVNLFWELFYILYLVWGAVIILWIIDIVKVCFNKFKIPVSLPYNKK